MADADVGAAIRSCRAEGWHDFVERLPLADALSLMKLIVGRMEFGVVSHRTFVREPLPRLEIWVESEPATQGAKHLDHIQLRWKGEVQECGLTRPVTLAQHDVVRCDLAEVLGWQTLKTQYALSRSRVGSLVTAKSETVEEPTSTPTAPPA